MKNGELDAATKARIRAEEVERARVRAELNGTRPLRISTAVTPEPQRKALGCGGWTGIGVLGFFALGLLYQVLPAAPEPEPPVLSVSTGTTTDNAVLTPEGKAQEAKAQEAAAKAAAAAATTNNAVSSPTTNNAVSSPAVEFQSGDPVTYQVQSSCPTNVTYTGDGGSIEQESNVEDGWTKDVAPGDFADISAQLQCEGGDVTVSVLENGSVLKEASSTGDYVIADAHVP